MRAMTDAADLTIDWTFLALSGPEARPFLDRLLTINVSDLALGGVRRGALLTPQGKIQHALLAMGAADGVILAVPDAANAPKLLQRLTLLKLRADVAIAEIARETLPDAPDLDAVLARTPAQRIAAGQPEQGPDYASESLFPTDVNLDLLDGVDYAKGCFIGQEVASRMKRRGSIRKRTLILTLNDADSAPQGAEVSAPGAGRIGETLSSANGEALAVLRLDRLAAAGGLGAALSVDGAGATARFPDYVPQEVRALTPDAAASAP